jgi:hypothetical protein
MRGQMFIIAAIFMVLGLVLIFNVLGVSFITEEKRFQEGRSLDKTAKNLLGEFRFAAGVATIKPVPNSSAADILYNFSSYIRDELDTEILYAFAFVNGTNQLYSINVGNFLDDTINISVNVTGSTPSSRNATIDDRKSDNFTFAASGQGVINVTLHYSLGNSNVLERFAINASAKNFLKAFFDVKLKDGASFIRAKEEYNRTW